MEEGEGRERERQNFAPLQLLTKMSADEGREEERRNSALTAAGNFIGIAETQGHPGPEAADAGPA